MSSCTELHDWIVGEEYGKEVTYCAQCNKYDTSDDDYEPDWDLINDERWLEEREWQRERESEARNT